ncbi:MAG: tetratricopeptide repeat protein [Phycisphaerae bacterium]|nr:tetratricopeptide repeat protein [Phycisphaerae bacterium]
MCTTPVQRSFLSVMLGLSLLAGTASAQSRKSVYLRGNLTVGQGPSTWNTSNMLTYSTGTEVLRQPAPTTGYTGALGSSIYQPQSMSYQVRSVAPPPTARRLTPVSPAATHQRLYTPSSPSLAPTRSMSAPMPSGGGTYVGSFTGGETVRSVASEQEMLRQLQAGRVKILADPDKPITTLVPEGKTPGRYRDFMKAGEWSFRSGRYDEALKQFQQAAMQAPSIPGAMIGCMMAQFARPDANYTEAADSLARALGAFPELPLVNLPPREYFGDGGKFDAALSRLKAFTRENPKDASAQFLLSYLLWREKQYAPAEAAMTTALEHSSSTKLTKAMETFIRNVDKTSRQYQGKLAALAPVQTYAWAGVVLALPDGFDVLRGDRAVDVVEAGRGGTSEAPEEFVGLYALTIGRDVTTGAFATEALEQFRSNPAVKNLRQIERGTGMIADCVIDARILQYEYEGRPSRAAAACFVREVKLPGQPADAEPVRMAYLIAVEVPEAKQDDLLPIIVAVSRSVKFTDLKRPIDLPLTPGGIVRAPDVGVAVAPPATWSAVATPEGVLTAQMDYLLGGVASPLAQAGSFALDEPLSNDQAVRQIVEEEKAKGYLVTVLDQAPAKLGELDGYQLVLQKQTPPEGVKDARLQEVKVAQPLAKPGPPYIEIVRFAQQKEQDGKTRGYYIGMSCFDADVERAKGVMDVLAKTFQKLEIKPAIPAGKTTP